MYTVDYFLNKFEALREEDFCVYSRFENGKRCAYGWCYATGEEARQSMFGFKSSRNDEENCLHALFNSIGIAGAAIVNNNPSERYPQPTPKQRILAALYDIKKMQTKDIDTGGKVKRIYVAVPVSITDQAKELVLS